MPGVTPGALVRVRDLKTYYPLARGRTLRAVDGVSFEISRGETLGIVGESGCGKTTCGKTVIGMLPKTSGSVLFDGRDVHAMSRRERFEFTRRAQMVFQDPCASLDPHQRVRQIVGEGMRIHGLAVDAQDLRRRVDELLEAVDLGASFADRHVHELSGGQRQRVVIARALSVRPEFLFCDEPVSALDVSLRAQVINLLKREQRERGLTMLFIAHDLAAVRYVSDRIAVMYLGRIVEMGTAQEIFSNPGHPYTKALLAAAPVMDPRRARSRKRVALRGDVPSPVNPPAGCRFCDRCPHGTEACRRGVPKGYEVSPGHVVYCGLCG